MKRTLAIFAKEPTPGAVKTRLAGETSAEWACRVCEAFLLDTLDRLRTFDVRRVIAFDPPSAVSRFEHLAAGEFELTPQTSGDLGQRLAGFLESEFHQGSRAVVIVGADSPTLPATIIAQAFAELARADLVLGPATDGGYYLIGCGRLVPALFEGIAWGSERVLEQTCERAHRLGLRLATLAPWYDVDTLSDWRMLRGHVAALLASGQDPQARRTLELLTAAPEK
jgi:rSAM/selenodomain-associated transferase 1